MQIVYTHRGYNHRMHEMLGADSNDDSGIPVINNDGVETYGFINKGSIQWANMENMRRYGDFQRSALGITHSGLQVTMDADNVYISAGVGITKVGDIVKLTSTITIPRSEAGLDSGSVGKNVFIRKQIGGVGVNTGDPSKNFTVQSLRGENTRSFLYDDIGVVGTTENKKDLIRFTNLDLEDFQKGIIPFTPDDEIFIGWLHTDSSAGYASSNGVGITGDKFATNHGLVSIDNYDYVGQRTAPPYHPSAPESKKGGWHTRTCFGYHEFRYSYGIHSGEPGAAIYIGRHPLTNALTDTTKLGGDLVDLKIGSSLVVNGRTALDTAVSFVDAAGNSKTMTFTYGLLTSIS